MTCAEHRRLPGWRSGEIALQCCQKQGTYTCLHVQITPTTGEDWTIYLKGARVFADESECGTLTESSSMQTVSCNKDARTVKVQLPNVLPARNSACRGLCTVKVRWNHLWGDLPQDTWDALDQKHGVPKEMGCDCSDQSYSNPKGSGWTGSGFTCSLEQAYGTRTFTREMIGQKVTVDFTRSQITLYNSDGHEDVCVRNACVSAVRTNAFDCRTKSSIITGLVHHQFVGLGPAHHRNASWGR